MGETNNPEGDKTPTGEEEQTPEKERTFTQKEADALVAKAKSDTLADYKRLETEFKRSQSVAEAAINRLRTIEESQLRAEEEAVRDDPEKLSALRLKRDASKRLADAEEKERTIQAKEAELQTRSQRILKTTAGRLSERYNVDITVLLKYGGADEDSMEELAKSFGERTEPTGEPKTTRVTTAPPSGKTKGTSGKRLRYKDVQDYSGAGKSTIQIMDDAKEVLEQFSK